MPHPILTPIRAPKLRDFASYWLACRRAGATVTRRGDFDMFHLPGLIPHLFLYDYHPGRRDFTLRVAGEEIRRLLPNSVAGTPLERIMPTGIFAQVQDRYRQVCELPAALHAVGRVFLQLGGAGVGERVVLPLADDQDRVHQLIGATLYQLGSDLTDDSVFASEEVTLTYTPLTPTA